MANSSTLTGSETLLAAQYNNLRLDAIDITTGHAHSGAADGGKYMGVIPIGGIVWWSSSAGSIPTRFQMCDGTNGTANLRDKFVIGAGGAYAVGDNGGAVTKDISHVHVATGLTLANESAHTHGGGTLSSSNAGAHTHAFGSLGPDGSFYSGAGYGHSVAAAIDHTHSVPTGASGAGSAHSHTTSGNLGTGGSATQNIMPAYYALIFIQRMS